MRLRGEKMRLSRMTFVRFSVDFLLHFFVVLFCSDFHSIGNYKPLGKRGLSQGHSAGPWP